MTNSWTAPNGVPLHIGQKVERTPENYAALAYLEALFDGKKTFIEDCGTISWSSIPRWTYSGHWPYIITALPEEKKPEPISFEEALALRQQGKPIWLEEAWKGGYRHCPAVFDWDDETEYCIMWIADQEGRKFYAENPEGGK